MLLARMGLSEDEIVEIRRVASLRFAADIAPHAFAGYLGVDADGRTVTRRLPAEDDPMFLRVARIRERDDMLIDTLNEHYADFHMDMEGPYRKWRAFAYEELVSLRKLKRDSNIRLAAGAVAILGGIALATVGAPVPIELLSAPLVAGGTLAIRSGWELRAETQIHAEAVRELGRSFESDVAPRVVEVEGRTLKLTGSAETQYQEWRRLLREIYLAETGFDEPLNPDDAPRPAGASSP
jgi:hypothetical protein